MDLVSLRGRFAPAKSTTVGKNSRTVETNANRIQAIFAEESMLRQPFYRTWAERMHEGPTRLVGPVAMRATHCRL